MGDEVQSGSVLLPASRRGRYLANIARRQAVDGTAIKFNKDADRMNAEAKKNVDVLSEELLPYIIAEQERRTTLYKRVMTAIQNGEKGVTIAEIRNKPPAVIRNGLMYRCPTNRAPLEPNGSGIIKCEDNLDPTPIMFESCLSAEDRELYVADNKYFFCNRHRIEGPDLPRNGTSVIGCAPAERTPLNYTSQKCALEDTDDVVVHYRYYPDRSYKFVSELDPNREVCEHWNPCQVGYIFGLTGPEQATPATELWKDDMIETISLGQNYATSTRRIRIPAGYEFQQVGKYLPNGQRASDNYDNIHVRSEVVGDYIKITMFFIPVRAEDVTTYYVQFENIARRGNFVRIPLVTLNIGQTRFTQHVQLWLPPQQLNAINIDFSCASCVLRGILLRAADGSIRNLEEEKYHLRKLTRTGESVIQLYSKLITPRDFGDYILMIHNDDGSDERINAFSLQEIRLNRVDLMKPVGVNWFVWKMVTYRCDTCEATDVQCRGHSVLGKYRFVLKPHSKSILVQIMSFKDSDACVYMGIFNIRGATYKKMVAVIENVTIAGGRRIRLSAPMEGAPFEYKLYYKCRVDCSLTKVNVNGLPLELTTQSSKGAFASYFLPENGAVTIGIKAYNSLYEGVYQGVFMMNRRQITKNLMEIRYGENLALEIEYTTATSPDIAEPEEKLVPWESMGQEELVPEEEPVPEEQLVSEEELVPEELQEEEEDDYFYVTADGRRKHQPPGTRRSGGKTKQSCTVHILRDSVPAGHAYKQKTVGYACPGRELVAVSCRGQNVTTGFDISTNNTVNIDFDHFEDTNACVYTGIFKIGQIERSKTLAVLEMINVTVSAAVMPPPSGEFQHKVVYTCNVAKCDPAMIYINDKTLRSDDNNPFFSYKSEMVKGNDTEILTVTINFSIKPFTEEYEGVYQLVVTNGTERVTKNIMEIGALV